MHLLREEEVQAAIYLLNVNTLLIHVVLQNELLEEKESSLVVNLLTHLNLSLPQVRRVRLLAIFTLLISHLKLKNDHFL